ncbi:hypothetical protein VaNZ11_016358 [Volvox africanus]|uniref:O-fucosyltransferase family protein n=1 Tax=Volvox africanus TaxID=51714 RepID=A0ABQ5SMM0_9CHLO|nr:hypothetical protein VaNZ11_016358 [Volvox africanus]
MRFLAVLLFWLPLRVCQAKRILQNEIFIVPILWHGPNNQITEIKEALSLSFLLPGSVAVIPNLQEHKFSDGGVHRMFSKELFDNKILRSSNLSYILLDDLRKTWDGVLDVILFLRDEDFPRVSSLVGDMGLKAPDQERWIRSPISVTRGCRQDQVQRLRKMLQPYRYVGMLCYDDFALQTHKLAGTLLSNCDGDLCCQSYKESSVLVRKSPQVCELAQDYIQRTIGSDRPFIAGHIRPMPDDCVKFWQSSGELDPIQMSDVCRNNYMYDRFVHNFQALQEKYRTKAVFIMTHPTIRPRVAQMLKAGGIDPLFIDIADLNASIGAAKRPLRTPLSFSLLAVVEEAVSAAATAFLGTAESSMTGMIVQERIARGLDPSTSYFFSLHPSCTVLPCAVPEYYLRRDKRLSSRGTSDKKLPLLSRLPQD